jgi:hypothetical protein
VRHPFVREFAGTCPSVTAVDGGNRKSTPWLLSARYRSGAV